MKIKRVRIRGALKTTNKQTKNSSIYAIQANIYNLIVNGVNTETLLRGRRSCGTDTDSVRRAMKRALGADSAEMRSESLGDSSEGEAKLK